MPTYEVDVAGKTYDVDAPDEATAWRWANQVHEQSQAPEPRGYGEEAVRQFGLAARSGIKGAVGLGSLLADSGAALANIAGARLPMPSMELDALLSRAGLPQPETKLERNVGQLTEAGTGAATGAGLFRGAANVVPIDSAKAGVYRTLASDPQAQAAAAATGALATSEARERGMSPQASIGLGLLGSIAGGGAASLAGGITAPFRPTGRQQIVGTLLREVATDPDSAISRLEASRNLLPGSTVNTFAASRDPGIGGAQNFIMSMDKQGRFGAQANQNTLARMQAIDRVTVQPRSTAIDMIGQRVQPMLDKAKPINPLQVIDEIKNLRASPEHAAAGDVLKAAESQFAKLADSGQDVEKAAVLWRGLRMKVNDWIGKRAVQFGEQARGIDGQELRALQALKTKIDDILMESMPEFQSKFMKPYSKLMSAKERGTLLEGLALRATGTGQKVVTEADELLAMQGGRWNAAVKNMLASGDIGKLTPTQRETVKAITKDFVANMPIPGTKPAGSDTFKNMTVAAVLGRITTGGVKDIPKWMREVSTGYGALLSKISEPQLQALIVDAALDPKLAAKLMRQADPMLVHSVARDLSRRAHAYGYGITTGKE